MVPNDAAGTWECELGCGHSVPPKEKQYLVCINCGEAFDSITAAHEHGVFIPGPDPSWCGEDGFNILPESEAF
jgi:hypothetical protein